MANSSEDVKLLGAWASPFVLRARIALSLKEVRHEFLEEVFGAKSELLLKSNPVYKKIPVLIHNGKPVCESMIIVQYIDEVWADKGAPFMPADPYDRAVTRFWAVYVDDKWFPALRGIAMAPSEAAKTDAISQVLTGLQLLEDAFKTCSKGKGFFNGDAIGYLDIALGCYLASLKAAEKTSGAKLLDEEKTPLLAAWAGRFCEDRAVKEVMPDTDRMVEFIRMMRAKFAAAPPAK